MDLSGQFTKSQTVSKMEVNDYTSITYPYTQVWDNNNSHIGTSFRKIDEFEYSIRNKIDTRVKNGESEKCIVDWIAWYVYERIGMHLTEAEAFRLSVFGKKYLYYSRRQD